MKSPSDSIRKVATRLGPGKSLGPVTQVGPVDLSDVESREDLEEKVEEVAERHDVDPESIDLDHAEKVGRQVLRYWKQSAQAGLVASWTGDYEMFQETVMGRQPGILQAFKGIGSMITGIAISLGVGAIILGKFQNQTSNSEADTILSDGLTLLQDTVGFMEIGVVMVFGVVFMRYME